MKKIAFLFVLLSCFIIGIDNANAESIKTGIYKIQSALDSNKVLDLRNSDTKNKTQIQLYDWNNLSSQKWKIESVGGGYYTISTLLDENKVIDVRDASKKSGTPIQIYSSNKTNAQKWLVQSAGNGYYYLVSKCNGLYMDVKGGKKTNGTDIQVYKGNKTNAQKFKLIELVDGTKTIEDGTYTISTALNTNNVFDIAGSNNKNGTNIQMYSKNETWAQVWNVKYLNDGYYSLTSYLDDSKSLDVANGSSANSTNVQLYGSNSTDAQKWIIKDAGDGTYNIISKLDNMYLDVRSGSTKSGANLQIYHGAGVKAQKFIFNKIEMQKLSDGLYTINSYTNQNLMVGLDKEIAVNQGNVLLKNADNSNTQKWYVKHLEKGYYSISSAVNSNKVLDVANGTKNIGTNIQLYGTNNTSAQKWYIKYAGNDSYYIISQNTSLHFGMANELVSDNSNIQLQSETNGDSQKFTFTATTINPTGRSYEDGYYYIKNAVDETKAIDVSGGIKKNETNIQLYQSNESLAQTWYLKYLDNGYYSVTSSLNPELSMTVPEWGLNDGANVYINRETKKDNQQWIIKDAGEGYVNLISKSNSLYVDLANGKTNSGTNIITNNFNGNSSQKFKLVKANKQKVYTGVDISHFNSEGAKSLDWNKIGNSNLNFIILKAAEGVTMNDAYFNSYVEQCEKYNIPYGVYLYSHANVTEGGGYSAVDEANHMLNLIKESEKKGYSPNLGTKVFLDMEKTSLQSLGMEKLTAIADKFCSTIENAGYTCGVYANQTWFNNYLNKNELTKKYVLWLAKYPPVPSPNFDYAIKYDKINNIDKNFYSLYKYWQFASDGYLPSMGIYGNVDMDIGYDIFEF